MRIKEVITQVELFWCLNKFSQLVSMKYKKTTKEDLYKDARA